MSSGPSSGFFGRQRELRGLSADLEQACAGGGRVVIVSGEGGIGKTRLCEELASVARELGAGVAWTACWESGGLPPFWPWRQLLDQLGEQFGPARGGEEEPGVARAELFADAAEAVRSAAVIRPWLLVFDDLHWADTGTIRLLAYFAPFVRSVRVLLVGTVRDAETTWPSLPADLGRQVRRVRLAGLGVEEVGELVEDLTGSRPGLTVRDALARATGGNPLFAAELVRWLHRDDGLGRMARGADMPVPPTIRAVLDEQLADLSAPCRQILAVAAVIGGEFPLALLAEVAGRDRFDVLAALDEAVSARVVAAAGVGRHAFSHPLVRSVLRDDIGISQRVRLHAQIGDALEAAAASGREVDPATLSFHYLNAAPAGTSGKAAHYAELAARSAMSALGYDDAVELYDRALAASGLDPGSYDRGSLLLGSAEAKAASGDNQGARSAFLATADLARRTGQWAQLARAALGLAGTGFEVALFDDEQITLLEEALRGVGDNEAALRSRISARLSVALSLTGQEQRRAALSEAAVSFAQESGDPAALAQALAARCDANAGPAHVAQRAADATEITQLARARGDMGTELLGRRLRLVAALEAGDMNTVDAQAHAFAAVADRLRQPRYQWYVKLWQATRAAMRGRLADQEALAREAEELGRVAGSVNCDILMLAHRWFAWLEAGDSESALSYFDVRVPPGSYAEMGPQMLPALAGRPLLAGRPDQARAVLDAAAEDLKAASPDSEWLTMLAQVADMCFRLGGHPLVPWLYDTLAPFADVWPVDGIGAYAHGPAHRQLGLLAVLLGRSGDASSHFEAALLGNRRAGADLLVARTLLDRGTALDEPETLRSARDLYRQLGADKRAGQIESALRGSTASGTSASPDADGTRFRRDGDVWTVVFAGRLSRVRDSKGIRDIARLLAEPGREIPALDLADGGAGGLAAGSGLGPLIDAKARAAYRARLADIEAELDQADSAADPERSIRAQAERDALLEQLSSAYGLAGRPRRTGDPAERARTAVTARIRDAIRRIERLHPELGRHLARSIRTGTFCAYDPDSPLRWEL